MPSRISGSNPTTTSKRSRRHRLPLFLMAALLCLSLLGCPKPCPVCPDLQITLPAEQAPLLRGAEATRRGSEYCLTDRARRDVLIDLELLRAWGAVNMSTIEQFNKRGER